MGLIDVTVDEGVRVCRCVLQRAGQARLPNLEVVMVDLDLT